MTSGRKSSIDDIRVSVMSLWCQTQNRSSIDIEHWSHLGWLCLRGYSSLANYPWVSGSNPGSTCHVKDFPLPCLWMECKCNSQCKVPWIKALYNCCVTDWLADTGSAGFHGKLWNMVTITPAPVQTSHQSIHNSIVIWSVHLDIMFHIPSWLAKIGI